MGRGCYGSSAIWGADGPAPIVVRSRLYVTGDVGDDLVIYGFDLDGRPRWQAKNGRSWTGSYPGARACCVYSAGKLYHMNAHGRVACFDAATGSALGRGRAGAVPGSEHHLGHERVPARRRSPADRHPGR